MVSKGRTEAGGFQPCPDIMGHACLLEAVLELRSTDPPNLGTKIA